MLSVNGPLVMPANANSIANAQCEQTLSAANDSDRGAKKMGRMSIVSDVSLSLRAQCEQGLRKEMQHFYYFHKFVSLISTSNFRQGYLR